MSGLKSFITIEVPLTFVSNVPINVTSMLSGLKFIGPYAICIRFELVSVHCNVAEVGVLPTSLNDNGIKQVGHVAFTVANVPL